jgi:glucose-6-phosphate 1-dehydrogenase
VPTGLTGYERPDRLRIGLGFGADHLCLDLNVNGPGHPSVIDPVTLQADIGPGELSEYGEVLRGILRGHATLTVRGDTAVECWRIIEPVRAAWNEAATPLLEYPAGSAGPDGWSSRLP